MPKFKTKDGTFNVPNVPAAISAFKKKYPDAVEIKEEQVVGSTDEETGEYLPFNKSVAGQGKGDISLDIKPWYGDEMKTNYTPEQWTEFVKSTGFKPTVKNTTKNPKAQVQEFQYYLAHHPDWKSSIDELHSSTEKGFGKPSKSKRKYDGYLGRRWDLLVEKQPQKQPELTQVPGITIAKTDKKDVETKPITEKKKRYIRLGDVPAPFDVRDVINMGLAGYQYANRPAWYPFQATPNVYKENYLLSDPTRALAANAELANIASQYNQAFTGPKRGQLSGIQGTAFKNAADTLAQYDNINRQVIDRVNSRNAAIMNAFSQNQALRRTEFYDDVVRANQQRVNEERALGTNLAGTITNALGNRAMYYNLNTLNPNFFADPRNAGMVTFTGDPTGYEPNYPSEDEYDKAYQKAKIYSPQNPWDAMKDILKIKGSGNDSYNEQIARLKEAGLM